MSVSNKVPSYILAETIDNKPVEIIKAVKEALADHFACTIAGSRAKVSRIALEFASKQWGVGESSLVLQKQKLSPAGAAFVNGVLANALDLDDGHRLTKGHPGAVIIPAVLAAAEERKSNGAQFLNAVLVGYEVGIRAGIIAHQSRPDYHCTGSWGAIGAAAGVSRILALEKTEIEHALGIAEYHGTYSPMMRCIDNPSMLKDGIGWGSMAGVSAAYLAKLQFSGIPSLFSLTEGTKYIEDLRFVYQIQKIYFKPHACCRWAQPAVECLKEVMNKTKLTFEEIDRIIVYTFTESSRLSHVPPMNTEEAQYNLLFPIASFLVFGEIGPNQVLHELSHKDVLKAMKRIETKVDERFDAVFPEKAQSQIEVYTKMGTVIQSSIMKAKGDYDFPLSASEKRDKFFSLTTPIIGEKKSVLLLENIEHIEELDSINDLLKIIND